MLSLLMFLSLQSFFFVRQDEDDEARVGEALTKTLVCALKTTPSHDNNDDWLNPTEVRQGSGAGKSF